jgi:hypothetical protein
VQCPSAFLRVCGWPGIFHQSTNDNASPSVSKEYEIVAENIEHHAQTCRSAGISSAPATGIGTRNEQNCKASRKRKKQNDWMLLGGDYALDKSAYNTGDESWQFHRLFKAWMFHLQERYHNPSLSPRTWFPFRYAACTVNPKLDIKTVSESRMNPMF